MLYYEKLLGTVCYDEDNNVYTFLGLDQNNYAMLVDKNGKANTDYCFEQLNFPLLFNKDYLAFLKKEEVNKEKTNTSWFK